MEAKSKGECIELAIDSLLKLEECCVDAVSWLEKSRAFVPDESEAIQELKDALAKSIERETELERRLAASFARERRLTSYIGGLSKMAAEAESILEDVSNIGKILPTPAFDDLMHIMAHGIDSTPQELTKSAEQPTGAKFPPWYNADSEFKA